MRKFAQDDPVIIQDVRPKLRRPDTEEEIHQAESLKRALQGVKVADTILLRPSHAHEPITLMITLRGARPEAAWAHWLVIRVVPARHLGWLARMTAFHPDRREIYAIPRPGTNDEAYAYALRKERILPPLVQLRLGVMLARGFFSIDFYFQH